MAKERRLNIRTTETVYNKLQKKAEDNGMNVSEYIRYLITADLKEVKK